MEMETLIVLVIALAIGIMLRTYCPFGQKKEAEPEVKVEFDYTYIGTAVMAFITALFTALMLLEEALLAMPPDIIENMLGLFVFGIFYAWGHNEMWNRHILKWFSK